MGGAWGGPSSVWHITKVGAIEFAAPADLYLLVCGDGFRLPVMMMNSGNGFDSGHARITTDASLAAFLY